MLACKGNASLQKVSIHHVELHPIDTLQHVYATFPKSLVLQCVYVHTVQGNANFRKVPESLQCVYVHTVQRNANFRKGKDACL